MEYENKHVQSAFLCIPNDTEGSTVLDTSTRILELRFRNNVAPSLFRPLLEMDLYTFDIESKLAPLPTTRRLNSNSLKFKCCTYQRSIPNSPRKALNRPRGKSSPESPIDFVKVQKRRPHDDGSMGTSLRSP